MEHNRHVHDRLTRSIILPYSARNGWRNFPVSSRQIVAIALLSALLLPQAAMAQFGGFSLPSIPRSSSSTASTDTGCKSPKKKQGAAIFGKIIGDAAGRTINRTGASRFLPVSEFSSTLTEAIACRLDPVEQSRRPMPRLRQRGAPRSAVRQTGRAKRATT
jgi:hypothetical protein